MKKIVVGLIILSSFLFAEKNKTEYGKCIYVSERIKQNMKETEKSENEGNTRFYSSIASLNINVLERCLKTKNFLEQIKFDLQKEPNNLVLKKEYNFLKERYDSYEKNYKK